MFILYYAGTGEYKLGANYAPSVYPQKKAAEVGYVQNLWLYGPEHYLTEVRLVFSRNLSVWPPYDFNDVEIYTSFPRSVP